MQVKALCESAPRVARWRALPDVQAVFRVTSLDKAFRIFPNADEAVRELARRAAATIPKVYARVSCLNRGSAECHALKDLRRELLSPLGTGEAYLGYRPPRLRVRGGLARRC